MVIVTEEIKNAFDALISEAQKQVKENSEAQMLIIAQSAKGNRYIGFVYDVMEGYHDDTNKFIQMLIDAEDVEIKYCVCMLNSGWLEPPYFHLKKSLLEISPKNEATIFSGQGENVIVLKTLKDMMP